MNTPESASTQGHHAPTVSIDGVTHRLASYLDSDDFLALAVPWVHDGIESGDEVLVVLGPRNSDTLRDALGPVSERVRFRSGADWSSVTAHAIDDLRRDDVPRRLRVLCELADVAKVAQAWTLDDSLRDLAAEGVPMSLLTPYHAAGPTPQHRASPQHAAPLAEPGQILLDLPVTAATLSDLRSRLRQCVTQLGLCPDRLCDLVLAVDEMASNAVCHGGGVGRLRVWRDRSTVVCEIADRGAGLANPLIGHAGPPVGALGGRGLWMSRQLVDLVQLRTDDTGTVVRLHTALAPA